MDNFGTLFRSKVNWPKNSSMKIKLILIYNDLISDYDDNEAFLMESYKKNSLFFNNIQSFKDQEELALFIEITLHYTYAFFEKGCFFETVELAKKKLNLINSEITRLNANELKDLSYYSILYLIGLASYRLKNYKSAIFNFSQLTKIYPENENYKQRLNKATFEHKSSLIHTFTIAIALALIVNLFVGEYFVLKTRILIKISGLIFLLGLMAYLRYLKQTLTPVNKNPVKDKYKSKLHVKY